MKCRAIQTVTTMLAIGVALSVTPVSAQSTSDLIPDEIRAEINETLSAGLNGLVAFGSASTLGSGYFTFDTEGAPDTELDVLRLFNTIDLVDPESSSYVPFINFGIGQVKYTEQVPPLEESPGLNDFTTVTSNSVALGVGVDIELADNFYLTPAFDFAYTETENKYDYNNLYSQAVLQFFDGNLFNWEVETLSYQPSIKARYEFDAAEDVTITPSVSYTQIYVESIHSSSDIIDVSTSAGVLKSRLKVDFEEAGCFMGRPLSIIPQVSRTDLYGDAREGLGIDYFHEVSLTFLAKDQSDIPLFKDVGITGAYSFGDNVSGWRIGLEAGF
jgi:hypothetical protein